MDKYCGPCSHSRRWAQLQLSCICVHCGHEQAAANWSARNRAREVMFVCLVNYHLASGFPAEHVLTGVSLFFFWCSSLKQQLVCEQEGEIKREMGFGSTEAVWIWSREAKQQTHPEFKWIFLKKGITSDYLHHRGEEDALVIGFCSAFVSFISLTVTCFHWFVHPNSLFPDRKREKLSQLSYQTEMQCYTNTARDVPVH